VLVTYFDKVYIYVIPLVCYKLEARKLSDHSYYMKMAFETRGRVTGCICKGNMNYGKWFSVIGFQL
jgi:hypothetical protein